MMYIEFANTPKGVGRTDDKVPSAGGTVPRAYCTWTGGSVPKTVWDFPAQKSFTFDGHYGMSCQAEVPSIAAHYA